MEQLAAIIIIAILIVVFIILGFVFLNGEGSYLIAGFNTMPSEDREKYDVIAICKFMGKMMFAISFSMLFWILSIAFDKTWLFVVGLSLFIGLCVFMLVYVNTGNRFKKEETAS